MRLRKTANAFLNLSSEMEDPGPFLNGVSFKTSDPQEVMNLEGSF